MESPSQYSSLVSPDSTRPSPPPTQSAHDRAVSADSKSKPHPQRFSRSSPPPNSSHRNYSTL